LALWVSALVFCFQSAERGSQDSSKGSSRPRAANTQVRGEISPADAQALDTKFQKLSEPANTPSTSLDSIVIYEAEANSYLKYRGHEFLPAGVHDPVIHIAPDRVSAAASIDFDELNPGASKADGWAAGFLGFLFKGKQQISASTKLETENGRAKISLVNLMIGSITIPQALAYFLVQNYLRTHYDFDLDKPFALPDHVDRIELSAGRATFVRRSKKTS